MTRSQSLLVVAFGALGALACDLESPAERGEKLFTSTATGSTNSAFAPYSCAFCHDRTAESPDDIIRPGASLKNVARRTAFWGGERRTLRDATNLCITSFMRGIVLQPEDPDWNALQAFLHSLSDAGPTMPALAITLPRDCGICPQEGCDACEPPARGDASAGATTYARACKMCHGDYGSENKPVANAPALRRGEKHVFVAGTKEDDNDNTRTHVAAKTRFGNFGLFGVPPPCDEERLMLPPGTQAHATCVPNMPPFVKERLSPTELVDILAYLFHE